MAPKEGGIDFPSRDPYRMRPPPSPSPSPSPSPTIDRRGGGGGNAAAARYTSIDDDEEKRVNSYLPYSNHRPELRPVELYLDETEHHAPHVRLDLFNAEGGSRSMLSAPALSLIKALATHPTHQHSHATSTSARTAAGRDKPAGAATDALANPLSSIELVQRRRQRRQRCTRRMHILCWGAALLLVSAGLVIFFCWPRTPQVTMANKAQSFYLPADWGPDHHPWLKATWRLNVTLDNTLNWIPTRLHGIDFTMVDDITGVTFATGHAQDTSLVLPPRTLHPLRVIMHVDYVPPSINDTTFQNLYNACGPKKMGASSDLDIHLEASFHIWGLAWRPTTITQPESDTFTCPTN